MKRARRRIALAVALVCLGVPAGASAAASPAQWRITDDGANTETVSVLHGWTAYSLVNRVHSYSTVRYKDRRTGPELKFGGGHNTWRIRIKTPNPNSHEHRADHRAVDPDAKVALYNSDSGDYLRWNQNSFGWDAQLEPSPAYEWKIAKTSGDGDVRIYNTTAHAYMVYGTQLVGIDLRWSPSSDPFPGSDDGVSGTPHQASVTMTAHPPTSGYVPFLGRFGGGVDFNGVLERVTAPSSTYSLYFIKPGHSSNECGDATAVESLGPGQTMSPAQMKSIWGDEKPPLDDGLTFLACASTNASSVFVNILWSSVSGDPAVGLDEADGIVGRRRHP